MECYACDREATQRCSRCGNAYCAEHGGDPNAPGGQALCAECLDPVSATPSGTVFRASLFALLGTSVLARRQGPILNVSVLGNFSFSDSPKTGMSVIVTACGDQAAANGLAERPG